MQHRFMLKADIHPDDYNKALAIVELAAQTGNTYSDQRAWQEERIIEERLGHGLSYTSVLRRQYSAEMDLKLPRNPDWQQVVKTLEAKRLENRVDQH